jgi:mitogen-activated protein kinase 1/3
VCAAEHTPTQTTVAIKKVTLDGRTTTAVKILREIKALSFFDHPNIVKLYDIVELPSKEFVELYFVIDFMDYDLDYVIRQTEVSVDLIRYLLYYILRGLKCIHSALMIHRDLKPRNILVNKSCDVQICDFGLAREMSDDLSVYVETRWYRAPEIIMDWRRYDTKVDIWSVGCILAEMLLRKPVWPGTNAQDQIDRILRTVGVPTIDQIEGIGTEISREYCISKTSTFGPHGEFDTVFGEFDPQAVDLLRKLVAFSPHERADVQTAIDHPFFDDVRVEDEPVCSKPFDLELDTKMNDTMDDYKRVQQLIWEEMLRFHPTAGQCDTNGTSDSLEAVRIPSMTVPFSAISPGDGGSPSKKRSPAATPTS